MTVNCIVQARMGSKRLPGKVMMEVNGKPLIGYLLDRAERAELVDGIVVAIPECDLESSLGRFLKFRGTAISVGPEGDVAKRFAIALEKYPCDVFVRLCADSPIVQPEIIDASIELIGEGAYVIVGAGWGNQAQAFRTDVFLDREPFMKGAEREHVGLWHDVNFSTVVDTPEDFERVKCMILQQQL